MANECGYKDAHNARVMFGRLKKKLEGGTITSSSTPTTPKKVSKRKAIDEAGKATPKRGKKAKSEPVVDPADDEDDHETTIDDSATPAPVPAEDGGDVDSGVETEVDQAEGGDVHESQSVKEED